MNSQGTVLNSWRVVTSDITTADVQSAAWSHSWVQGQFIQFKLAVNSFAHFSPEKAWNFQSSASYTAFHFRKLEGEWERFSYYAKKKSDLSSTQRNSPASHLTWTDYTEKGTIQKK